MQHISISTDKTKLQVNYIHQFLSEESYWAKNIPIDVVIRSIDGSTCFGVYDDNRQIGFARVITDHATFAYLADVFIDKAYRKKGISKQLMSYIMEHDSLKGIRSFMLATLDAHSLYEHFGFKSLKEPGRYMSLKFFDTY